MSTAPHRFAPTERPLFPGGPYIPEHPTLRRLGYAAIGTGAGLGSTLGNGLVTVNVQAIAGFADMTLVQASILPALYVAFNATANLMLIKGRAQFGIPAITQGALIGYASAALLHLLFPGFGTAMILRAASGVASAALVTFGLYNWLQVFSAVKLRPIALVIGISINQLGLPVARLFPVEMLAFNNWQGLTLTELGLALALLFGSAALPLPPSDRVKVFERWDLVTFGLALSGMIPLCIVLSEGRILWWGNAPWLGILLAFAAVMLTCAILVENNRARPLLQLDWISSTDIFRFVAVAFVVRLALAEQTYGAVGLLSADGLTNDQLRTLFLIVAAAMLAGMLAVIATVKPERLPLHVFFASLVIAGGAWLDSQSSPLTRPEQLYLSQAMIGFGTTLFIGPALLYGFVRMMERGASHLVSFIVLFNVSQNVGGLAGTALLGSYQVAMQHYHAATLAESIFIGDAQAAARIAAGAGALGGVVTDPALRGVEGGALLGGAVAQQAAYLAFNDVFRFVALMALLTAAFIGLSIVVTRVRAHLQSKTGAAS